MTEISLPFIFRLHRLFFGVSSAFPKERLLNFSAFYFGGIRVDFSRFALYFGGAKMPEIDLPKQQKLQGDYLRILGCKAHGTKQYA